MPYNPNEQVDLGREQLVEIDLADNAASPVWMRLGRQTSHNVSRTPTIVDRAAKIDRGAGNKSITGSMWSVSLEGQLDKRSPAHAKIKRQLDAGGSSWTLRVRFRDDDGTRMIGEGVVSAYETSHPNDGDATFSLSIDGNGYLVRG